MAEPQARNGSAAQADKAAQQGEQPPASRGGSATFGGSKLKLAGFVLGLITVEAAAAYFILPVSSDAKPPQMEGDAGASAFQPTPSISVPEAQIDPTEGFGTTPGASDIEVDLGQFSVTAYQPTSQTTLRIDFHLWGTIDKSAEAEFRAAWEKSVNRLRDQIIVIVRGAELSDLTDAGLGLIKRKILEKVNHTLGKPYLRTVVFSEYSFLEQ
ncbi:MAG: flagellar basal body-associated FliL family protein [Thermogutta sp.]